MGAAEFDREELAVTQTAARKPWTRPELVRLGRIEDVAAVLGTMSEAAKLLRS